MHLAGHAYELLSPAERERIYRSALRLLAEMGMEIQHADLLEELAGHGLSVDRQTERVRFPTPVVERCLAEADKTDWDTLTPHVSGSAGVYHSLYHDPASGALLPWTEERLRSYFTLARRLPQIGHVGMLGCRLPVPAPLEPLYERYYCWKYGASDFGTLHLDELCPYILEIYQALADERHMPVQQVFNGVVYLVPALKLGRHEAYQFAYFRARGLRVALGASMFAAGANAPMSMAGAVTLNLAEQLALHVLKAFLFGDRHLSLGVSVSVLDMRTWLYPFGRPEMAIANLMTAQLARWLGASFGGHCGLTDAPLPSPEASLQKALTAIPTLLAGGRVHIDSGLLARDEVCSPIQLVLDNELIAALTRYVHEFEVSDEAIGLDTILAAGPGGQYLDCEHTVAYLRREYWEPTLWTRHPMGDWLDGDRQLDMDRARAIAIEMGRPAETPGLSPLLERALLQIIEAARRSLFG